MALVGVEQVATNANDSALTATLMVALRWLP
jgi:hypothetical protein